MRNRVYRMMRTAGGGCLCLLAACTTITTHKPSGEEIVMTQEEFARYVEHVFRFHNQVMGELIEVGDERKDEDTDEIARLEAAEKKMVRVCEPLNELVSETLSGENVGLQLKLDLIDAVPACEEASQTVEDLIP